VRSAGRCRYLVQASVQEQALWQQALQRATPGLGRLTL